MSEKKTAIDTEATSETTSLAPAILTPKVNSMIYDIITLTHRSIIYTLNKTMRLMSLPFLIAELPFRLPYKIISVINNRHNEKLRKEEIEEIMQLKKIDFAQAEELHTKIMQGFSEEYFDFSDRYINDPEYLPPIEEVKKVFFDENFNTSSQWKDLITKSNFFELFSLEYINKLSEYISERIELEGNKNGFPVKILEIGAGNGKLTHSLKKRLNEIIPGKFEITAIDDKSWDKEKAFWFTPITVDFPVEEVTHEKALEKYKPQIVLCSWMSPGKDLSEEICKTDSVDEYILIGDTSCCGTDNTWEETYKNYGFTQKHIEELSVYQRYQRIPESGSHPSGTYSFRRE